MRNVKGRFIKGFSGNPEGRPKGLGKAYQERKDKLFAIVEAIEEDYLEADLEKLSSRDRMRLYTELHEYLVPKLQRTETVGSVTVQDLLNMPPEQQKAYILSLRAQQNEEDE